MKTEPRRCDQCTACCDGWVADHRRRFRGAPGAPLPAQHRHQIHTWLRLTGVEPGLLVNFGAALMKDGILGFVNALDG